MLLCDESRGGEIMESGVSRRPAPAQALLALVGAAAFVLLGLLTMHIHGADTLSPQGSSSITAASAPQHSMVPDDAQPHSTADAHAPQTGTDSGHLGLITACAIALFTALALIAPHLRRALSHRTTPSHPTVLARTATTLAVPGRLFLVLQVIRT